MDRKIIKILPLLFLLFFSKSFSQNLNLKGKKEFIIKTPSLYELKLTARNYYTLLSGHEENIKNFQIDKQNGFCLASFEDKTILLSLKKNQKPIIGFIEEGNLTLEDIAFPLKDRLKKKFLSKEDIPTKILKKRIYLWKILSSNIRHFKSSRQCEEKILKITTKWGQKFPYNCKSPGNGPAGCGAVAGAQIAKYHKFPYYFDYSLIPVSLKGYDNRCSEEHVNEVATLIAHIGRKANQNYWSDRAFAVIEQFNSGFKDIGFHTKIISWFGNSHFKEDIIDEIKRGRPVFFYGVGNFGYLHYFVIHGYKKCNNEDVFFKINWGWEGLSDNGYYDLDNLSPIYSNDFFKYSDRFIKMIPGYYPAGYNVVRAKHSKKCLDVYGKDKRDGANVQQYDCHGKLNQMWHFVRIYKNIYKIVSANSKKCLDVKSPSKKEGANIQQFTCYGTSDQLWIIERVKKNYYRIKSYGSGKCLTVEKGMQRNNANIIQSTCKDKNNQLWLISPNLSEISTLDKDIYKKNYALFYEHEQFNKFDKGKYLKIKIGFEVNNLKTKEMNDKISSYKIGELIECVITTNTFFEGDALYLSSYQKRKFMPYGFNDSISSIKCENAGYFTKNSKHENAVYEYPYFAGRKLTLRSTTKISDLNKHNFDDKISSIRLDKNANFKCEFYKDKNFKNKLLEIKPGGSYDNLKFYRKHLNNSISSIKCYKY